MRVCPANSGDYVGMRWNNFRSDAKWKRQLFSTDQWRAAHPKLHWIFLEMPFMTMHNIEPDELHILYLGVVSYMLGSVMWLLCFKMLPGTPEQNMQQLWAFITEFYRGHSVPTQFTNLNLGSFVDANQPRFTYPKLKGRGAEIRNLVWPLSAAWDEFGARASPEFTLVRTLLKRQLDVQAVLSNHAAELFLPVDEAMNFRPAVDDVLRIYSKLANQADQCGSHLWSITPKFHWLWHLAHCALHLNPRANNCMIDEDFVGDIKEGVAASVSGTSTEKVVNKVMEKYRWAMHFNNCY